MYRVREIFYSLQGEGAQSGRPAVFCRFTGCNLWSGRDEDRPDADCGFCDTNFLYTDGVNGGSFFIASDLADRIESLWPASVVLGRFVVFTGGEPLLQLDTALIRAVHSRGFEVAVETNGTIRAPEGINWICVSPKAGVQLVQDFGNELKLVVPQEGQNLADYEKLAFDHFFLQPMDSPDRDKNTELAVEMCLHNPRWKLSLQIHKYLRIP
jgi:7-carboxy-7-deazaguanine synthase (Cx14CxxC type)